MAAHLPACSDSDGFQLVTRRGRRKAPGARRGAQPARRTVYSGPSREELYTALDSCRTDMEASQFYREFLGKLLAVAGIHSCTYSTKVSPEKHWVSVLTSPSWCAMG